MSIVDSGVLKSPTMIALLSNFLEDFQDFTYIFGDPMLGHICLCLPDVYYEVPLSTMKCPSVSIFMAFVLKSILLAISIVTSAFYSYPFSWEIFF